MTATLRALLDTNLFINFLLSRSPTSSAVGVILEAASAGAFALLFAPETAAEIGRTVAGRPHLSARIAPSEADVLVRSLVAVSERLPPLRVAIPRVVRDPEDDYLIAQAIVGRADYLVSRDRDLLDLGRVNGVRIVDPPEFLHVLRETGRLAE